MTENTSLINSNFNTQETWSCLNADGTVENWAPALNGRYQQEER